MINKISITEISFKSYRQKFTNEEFQQKIDSSLAWAKENVDNLKYLKTKKQMNKKLENNARNSITLLEKYKTVFKKSDFEPHVELSLQDKNLIGKVSYLSSKPIEIKTQLPGNLKDFFTKIISTAKLEMQEYKLGQKYWELDKKEKSVEEQRKKRFKELCEADEDRPKAILLAFDAVFSNLNEKLLKIATEKKDILEKLAEINLKLKDQQFKLKLK